MPQQKRRKLSLDEQDGKESERSRIAVATDDAIGNVPVGDAGTSGSQPDKRTRSERKGEVATQSVVSSSSVVADEGKDETTAPSSSSDGCERVSFSGRVIRQTNKGRCFTAALEAALNKQSTASISSAAGPASSSAATGSGVSVQSSVKLPVVKASTVQSTVKPPVIKANTPVRKKRAQSQRRVSKGVQQAWSKFEHNTFFEGLAEYGKDFDAIHNMLLSRCKKRKMDSSVIKTKEQLRHLYYRSWQKISKHVKMGNNVKKETQELYGLLNYYAIRKVFKRLDERALVHLNELIHNGVSKVREPNLYSRKHRKKCRIIRTPVCNALKKLNNLEDAKEDVVSEMPQQVTVELTPRCSAAWLKVHSLSHNPRVRFQVSVNRSLAGLVDFLRKKWKGPKNRLLNSLGGGGEEEETEELVVFPHHSYKLQSVVLTVQRPTPVNLITFSSYRNNVLSSPSAGSSSAKKGSNEEGKATNSTAADPDLQPNPEGIRPARSNVKVNLLPKLSDSAVQMLHPPCDDENAMFPDTPFFSSSAVEKEAADCKTEPGPSLGSAGNDSPVAAAANSEGGEVKPATDPSLEVSPHSKEKGRREEVDLRRLAEVATKGFTAESGQLVTLSQLSLLLDKTDHIRLEYEWRPKGVEGGGGVVSEVERLTNMLRRLSSLAHLEYRDILQRAKMSGGGKMSQCTLCGHSLEKVQSRKKTTCDVATETLPMMAPASVASSIGQPARLNSNGTLVGMAAKSSFVTLQTPDTDGVFRVPMPIAMPMSVRSASPQRVSTQPNVAQLIRPPEAGPPKPSFLLPRKRKSTRKPVYSGQRTLLPKMSGGQMFLVPQGMVPHSAVATPTWPAPPSQLLQVTVTEDSLLSQDSSGQLGVSSDLMQPGESPYLLQPGVSSNFVHQSVSSDLQGVSSDFLHQSVSPDFAHSDVSSDFVQTGISSDFVQPGVSSDLMQPGVSLECAQQGVPENNQQTLSQVVLAVPQSQGDGVCVSSTAASTLTSAMQMSTGASIVSTPALLGDSFVSSSDLFVCPLDMPILVSPTSSPVKSTQQVITNDASSPSLSSMLDLSLPAPSNQGAEAGDKFLDMVVDGSTGFSGLLKSPTKREGSDGHLILADVHHGATLPPNAHRDSNHCLLRGEGVQTEVLHTPQHTMSTPPHHGGSPPNHSPLKAGTGTQWLVGEGADLSLSCFDSPVKNRGLGADTNSSNSAMDLQASSLSLAAFLESPLKKSQAGGATLLRSTPAATSTSSSSIGAAATTPSFIPAPPSLFGDNSQDSLVARLDMDTALQSVMIESSIDYSSKFEKLAEHLADSTDASHPPNL